MFGHAAGEALRSALAREVRRFSCPLRRSSAARICFYMRSTHFVFCVNRDPNRCDILDIYGRGLEVGQIDFSYLAGPPPVFILYTDHTFRIWRK